MECTFFLKPLFQQKKLKKNRDVDSNGTRPLFDKYKSKYGNYSILKAYELGQRGAKSSMNYVYTEKGKPIPSSSSVYCSEKASSKNGR